MKNIFYILLALLISSCSSLQKPADYAEYEETDKLITDMIFNTYGYYLGLSPVDRTLISSDVQKKQIFDAYGYRIYLPWQIDSKTIRNEYTSVIYSPGNYVFAFDNPYNSVYSDTFMDAIDGIETTSANLKAYKEYMKSKSIYEICTAALNLTYDSISPKDPLNQKLVAMGLLLLKYNYLIEPDNLDIKSDPFYHFTTDSIKGFQIGDTINGRWVRIALFPHDKEELNMLLTISKDFKVSQSDIDYLIQHIEKIH